MTNRRTPSSKRSDVNGVPAQRLRGSAISIAEKQGAKLWELRAAVSFARLLRDRRRYVDACKLPAPL
jgi:hypothetical protein